MSHTTASDLFSRTIDDKHFSSPTQQKVINAVNPQKSGIYYQSVLRLIKSRRGEFTGIRHLAGTYRYFRNNIQGDLVSGAMRIYRDEASWAFDHYKFDIDQAGFDWEVPTHKGFAFLIGDRLYLMGIGPRYMRPVVCNSVGDVSQHFIEGVVIAIREGGGPFFAANFIMIHETHAEFVSPNREAIKEMISRGNKKPGVLLPGAD